MRKHYLLAAWVLATLFSHSSFSQSKQPELTKGNYVVVGAYLPGDEKYLDIFMKSLQARGLNPKSGFESGRNFYYVYLDVYSNFEESVLQMQKARQNGGLENAWIRVIKDDKVLAATVVKNTPDPISDNERVKTEVVPDPVKIDASPFKEVIEVRETLVEDTPIDNPPVTVPTILPTTLENTEVFLSVYDALRNKVIQGDIEVVDTDRAQLLAKVKGNDYLKLIDPKSKNGQLTLICNVFGYRKAQRQISYPNPVLDEEADMFGNFFMVKFEMIRYQRGDISVLYNVYFYNDAAIMLPESKYELNRLLDMMQENPEYKIVLHGHSNGSARGPIIMVGPTKDFFNLTKDVKKSSGSAKELSNQRAIVIREWLLSQGVSADRVGVKAWGGKRMIHDKLGVNAKKNIRVEVEVLED